MTANAAWNVWNFRRPVVEALLSDGHDISVLACPDETGRRLTEMGCRFVPLVMSPKGINPLEGLALVRRFSNAFRAESPDVILSYTIKNNIFGAVAARLVGAPFIPNVTGLGTAFLSGPILKLVAETLYRRAFAALPVVFFQNLDDQSLFLERRLLSQRQVQLLPGSGIDLKRFSLQPYPGRDENPIFLMIGRLLRDKGVFEFVEAARRVKAARPGARFQLLGPIDAANRSAVDRGTVQGWVSEGLVEYLGVTDDVRPFITECDCVVLPSYREGAPRTLIEAAAMGRPVIATDVPGCRSVVDDAVTGLLCLPRDGKSLADAILDFLAKPLEARAAMGIVGRVKMEREYDEAHVVSAYRGAIKRVAKAQIKVQSAEAAAK